MRRRPTLPSLEDKNGRSGWHAARQSRNQKAARNCLGQQESTSAPTPTPGRIGVGVASGRKNTTVWSPLPVPDRAAGRDQYESELITSPPARVPSCHHVFIEIELLMNVTWPSAIRTLQPPGWLLEAFMMFE